MAKYTGGCLCGAIKYEVNGDLVFSGNCHCDDCRRLTGSAFATLAFFKAEDVAVTKGTTKSFAHTADSGNSLSKEFCGTCGSQLFGSGSGRPGLKSVKIGTMDDVGSIRPTVSVYVSKALPFTIVPTDTKNFDKMPTG